MIKKFLYWISKIYIIQTNFNQPLFATLYRILLDINWFAKTNFAKKHRTDPCTCSYNYTTMTAWFATRNIRHEEAFANLAKFSRSRKSLHKVNTNWMDTHMYHCIFDKVFTLKGSRQNLISTFSIHFFFISNLYNG